MLTLVAAATASAALLSPQGAPRVVSPPSGAAAAPVDNWGRRALCSSAALASAAPLLPADAAVKDWQVVNLPILSETAPILFDIEFDSKDRNLGWIVGNRGTFLQTSDAGKSWTAKSFANLDPDEEINYRFTKVSFMDGAHRCPPRAHRCATAPSPPADRSPCHVPARVHRRRMDHRQACHPPAHKGRRQLVGARAAVAQAAGRPVQHRRARPGQGRDVDECGRHLHDRQRWAQLEGPGAGDDRCDSQSRLVVGRAGRLLFLGLDQLDPARRRRLVPRRLVSRQLLPHVQAR